MKKIISFRAPLLSLFLTFFIYGVPGEIRAQEITEAQSLPLSKLVIESGGQSYDFVVELADSFRERQIGLMFRYNMPKRHGMLFLNDQVRDTGFWMKNTFISLDIIFVTADGKIKNIAKDVPINNLNSVYSDGPILSVLELNAGMTSELGIKPGDQLRHEIFGTAK